MLSLHAQYIVVIAFSSEGKLPKGRGVQVVAAIDQEVHSKRLARLTGINVNTVRLKSLHRASLDFPTIVKQKEKLCCMLVE